MKRSIETPATFIATVAIGAVCGGVAATFILPTHTHAVIRDQADPRTAALIDELNRLDESNDPSSTAMRRVSRRRSRSRGITRR